MARPKGSVNKKTENVNSDFENKELLEQPTEVSMNATDEVLETLQQELDLVRIELERTKLEIEAKKHELKTMTVSTAPDTIVKDVAVSVEGSSLREKIAAQKERDSVMVTGKFYNLRVKGQSVKLPYSKYGDEPVKWHPFDHGKVYTIPKGFADQINGGTETDPCYYTPHFMKNEGIILNPDDPETGINSVDTSDKKYSFVPLHF